MTRHAKRTDKSQKGIVDELRKFGVQVVVTNFGESFPDLLCGYFCNWALVEIKESDGAFSRGQLEFLATSKGKCGVATNAQEAFQVVKNDGHLYPYEQNKIDVWLIRNPTQQSLSVKKFFKVIA